MCLSTEHSMKVPPSFLMLHYVSTHPVALGGGPEAEASFTKEKSQLWLTGWNLPESARDSHENTAPGAFCGLWTRELTLPQAGLTHQGHHLASWAAKQGRKQILPYEILHCSFARTSPGEPTTKYLEAQTSSHWTGKKLRREHRKQRPVINIA